MRPDCPPGRRRRRWGVVDREGLARRLAPRSMGPRRCGRPRLLHGASRAIQAGRGVVARPAATACSDRSIPLERERGASSGGPSGSAARRTGAEPPNLGHQTDRSLRRASQLPPRPEASGDGQGGGRPPRSGPSRAETASGSPARLVGPLTAARELLCSVGLLGGVGRGAPRRPPKGEDEPEARGWRWDMRVKSSAFAALAAGLALAASAAPTRAQSLLGGLIERCSRGDMAACSQATRLSALQANARAARNAPASSPGVGAVTGNGMYVYCAAPSVCGARTRCRATGVGRAACSATCGAATRRCGTTCTRALIPAALVADSDVIAWLWRA